MHPEAGGRVSAPPKQPPAAPLPPGLRPAGEELSCAGTLAQHAAQNIRLPPPPRLFLFAFFLLN